MFSELELCECCRFFDLSCERRIREEYIKIEMKIFFFILFIHRVFIELREEVFTLEIHFCCILPRGTIERILLVDMGLPISGDEHHSTSYLRGLLIEVDPEEALLCIG